MLDLIFAFLNVFYKIMTKLMLFSHLILIQTQHVYKTYFDYKIRRDPFYVKLFEFLGQNYTEIFVKVTFSNWIFLSLVLNLRNCIIEIPFLYLSRLWKLIKSFLKLFHFSVKTSIKKRKKNPLRSKIKQTFDFPRTFSPVPVKQI
jgi:hypothetical protein